MLCTSVSHFSCQRIPSQKSEGPSTALQCWPHLTSVTASILSEATILHLSKLPSLQLLQLKLPPTPMSVDTQKLQHPVFCAVQELVIECSSMVLLDAFFKRFFVAPKLLPLEISAGVDTARALPASISRLSNGCAQGSLEQVELYINDLPEGCATPIRTADRITSIKIAVFRPLFAFRNLRKLDFRAFDNYVLRWDDADLLQMAKAWPLLEVLHLNQYDHSSRGITPSAFILLLQHCPSLVSVAVIVNWSTVDRCAVSPDAPYRGFAHKAISEVFFGSPRIAAFISAILPSLELIVT
ncbi:hypothetical protein BDR03DRAFT_178423 [Suillus americanus]|nr:hypothetical protein BDR03DRAFT_178423 [Suillus americanus]